MYIDINGHSAGAINFSCSIPHYDETNTKIDPIKYYIGAWENDNKGLRIFSVEGGVRVDAPLFASTPAPSSSANQVATKEYVDNATNSSLPVEIILKGGSASSWL